MSMKECHECGQDISSKAKACPNCGAKRRAGCAGNMMRMGCLLMMLGALAFVALFLIAGVAGGM